MLTNKSWHVFVKLVLSMVMLFSLSAMAAEGERPSVNFNHDQTTFPLRGLHTNASCESCHTNGVFKGTPNTCEGCHNRGGANTAKLKPATHIPTVSDCSTCHVAQGWLPARFSHSSFTQQSCATCHNNVTAAGKPANHFATNLSCDTCHRTTAWFPASSFNHLDANNAPITSGCSSCHNGTKATGKPLGHIFTSADCSFCHASTSSWLGATFVHPSSGADCLGCHGPSANTAGATKMPVGKHVPISTFQCDRCHVTSSWLGVIFNHGRDRLGHACADCHNGSIATGKTSKHITTSSACDVCHQSGTSSWLPVNFTHDGNMTNCSSCHNGTAAPGKPTGHINTSSQCSICHTTVSWASATFNHSGVNGSTNCAQSGCHDGSNPNPLAKGIPGSHAHVGAYYCSACHRTTAWSPATFSHSGVAANTCNNCHGSIGPATKTGAGHWVLSGQQCDACHRTTAWVPVTNTYSHSQADILIGFATHSGPPSCRSCHTSSSIRISNAAIAGTPNCALCHVSNFRAGSHVKTQSPSRVLYTATELHDCTGDCHLYKTNNFSPSNIQTNKTRHHRSTDGGW